MIPPDFAARALIAAAGLLGRLGTIVALVGVGVVALALMER
jgi:hypothetical protein